MSEYQYYEFQAIDRLLSKEEMETLRASSTRAQITPSGFVNEYSCGNFKGSQDAWMEEYFDAFIYFANWGTRILKLRLPARLLDTQTVQAYFAGKSASVRYKNDKAIVSFVSDEEGDGGWVGSGEYKLSSLVPLRAELARGDLRALYLGWLLGLQNGHVDEAEVEPPVPAGLGKLSSSLRNLIQFLRIDTDLIAAAAAASAPLESDESRLAGARVWVARLPEAEKEELLARLIVGDTVLAKEILHRLERERANNEHGKAAADSRRTGAQLSLAAEAVTQERRRLDAERAAAEKAKREREAAEARKKHIDRLVGQEPVLWRRVEASVGAKSSKHYDEAVALLADLQDLAARSGDGMDFRRRLEALRIAHTQKRTFIDRLREAGL